MIVNSDLRCSIKVPVKDLQRYMAEHGEMKVMDCQNEGAKNNQQSPYFKLGREIGQQVASGTRPDCWQHFRTVPSDISGNGPQARYDWLLGYDSAFGGYDRAKADYGNLDEETGDKSNELTAAIILDRAKHIVTGQRQTTHGKPERSFEQIAARWSLTLGMKVTPFQVALMMADMKQVRALEGVTEGAGEDHLVDMVGYVALAGEMR